MVGGARATNVNLEIQRLTLRQSHLLRFLGAGFDQINI
jgi:hypothetical protein